MTIRQAFEKIKGDENHWAAIELTRELHIAEEGYDRALLTGRILRVEDDYVEFANYSGIDHLEKGYEPTLIINLSYTNILGWH